MLACPLCAQRRDYFTFTRATSHTHDWWSIHVTDSPDIFIGTDPSQFAFDRRILHICRSGHFWPSDVAYVRIYRTLGTTAAGKSVLLRNMVEQDPSGVRLVQADGLCRPKIPGGAHAEPTSVLSGHTHRLQLTDLLNRYEVSGSEVIKDLLGRSSLSDEEVKFFGNDSNLPFHLLAVDQGGIHDTLFVDLAGEAMNALVDDDLELRAISQLKQSEGLIWVVDTALFPSIRAALTGTGNGRVLLESLRPQRYLDTWVRNPDSDVVSAALEEALDASGDRLPITQGLSRWFSQSTEHINAGTFRAVVLTKADLLTTLLQSAGGWELLADEDLSTEEFFDQFVRGGVEFLVAYATKKDLAVDQATREVLDALAAGGDELEAQRRAAYVVRGVLDYYADPRRLKALVLREPGVALRGPLHEIECVGATDEDPRVILHVFPMAKCWEEYRAGQPRLIQHRDLVVGVLVRCLLGHALQTPAVGNAEKHSIVRYFLTCPMNAARQAQHPEINTTLSETPGVLHLLAWIMA